jgi:putative nucleotidyltransferase with HDIG domain
MRSSEQNHNLFIYHDLIAAIVAAMEARDQYTGSHSRRVSDMSEQICRLLGLPADETVLIHIAADLHDIGKIGISNGVLRHEGALDEEDWRLMKQHPLIGYDILNKVSSFQEIALIVRHHHERWNGGGYPDGIAGDSIPLGSRIIAIADSIDAMMSDRLYRKKLSSGRCRQEIIKNRGVMYDPNITDAVLAEWDLVIGAGTHARARKPGADAFPDG